MLIKEDDFVDNVIIILIYLDVLFFINKGRVYKLRVYEIFDVGR